MLAICLAWVFAQHLGGDGAMHLDKRICKGIVVDDTLPIPAWCDRDLSDRTVVFGDGRRARIVGVSPDHVLYLKGASCKSPLTSLPIATPR